MSNQFLDKSVIITGGTGSFGTAMVTRLLRSDVREIRIFSRDEAKQEKMRVKLAEPRLKFFIGDVRDRSSIDSAMVGVDLAFHAAALKQVPSCEFFPDQAVKTNILGSQNTIESAIEHNIECIICLGTDKAVFPVNAMGMTKALMEKVAQAAARRLQADETRVCSVRYGNVMCSRGSVIPLFIAQIKADKAITVTEPLMTRFMLPLADAIDLVEFAWQNGCQGDVFVRKAPACTIGDLATALKEIFESDVPIKTIGLRHGEKVFETLATASELRRSEDLGDYLRVRMDGRDLNYAKFFTEGDPEEISTEDYHSHNTQQLSVPELRELLLSLPEVRNELPS